MTARASGHTLSLDRAGRRRERRRERLPNSRRNEKPEPDWGLATNASAIAQSEASRKRVRGVDIPIIAMTANAMIEDRQRRIESGMNDHLAKPIALGKVRQMLSQWGPSSDGESPS